MTTYFISRHPGAVDWVRQLDIEVDHYMKHLDINRVRPGDCVIGSLPVNIAARVCQRGARYVHLSLELPEEWRGKELTAKQISRFGAKLESYVVKKSE